MRTTADAIRPVLLPVELAEAELRAKPAAAVLVLLRRHGISLDVLLGRRTRREGDPWSGQIGLPGGGRHPEDASLAETALRETREEVGLDLRGRADLLGHMSPRSPGNVPNMLVVPFVALATAELHPRAGPEMEEAFWTALEELPTTWAQTTVHTRIGELRVPAYMWRDRVIWGFTFRVLEELLVLLEVTL